MKRPLNILFCMIADAQQERLWNCLHDRLDNASDTYVNTATMIYARDYEAGRKRDSCILWSDIGFVGKKGKELPNYDEYTDTEKLLPVDAALLDAMAPHEQEILKMLDRHYVSSYEVRWRNYMMHLRFWNSFLKKNEINLFIHVRMPHQVVDYIIYLLCQINHIKYVGSESAYFLGYTFVHHDIYHRYGNLEEAFQRIVRDQSNDIELNGEALEAYDKFVVQKKDAVPIYMNNFLPKASTYLHRVPFIKKRCKELYGRVVLIKKLIGNMFNFDISVFSKKRFFANSRCFREFSCLYSFYSRYSARPVKDDKYFYVPLNYQPEQTSSPEGGRYADILLYIQMLSYYLPEDYYLYIKEHPTILAQEGGSREDCFYAELVKLKNVKLIPWEENTFELIRSATAIAVLTGTAGIEGIFRRKPCLVFGNIYIETAPGAFRVRTNQECSAAIQKIISHDYSITDRDLRAYLKASFEVMIYGTLQPNAKSPLLTDDDNIKNLAEGYTKEIMGILQE